MSCWTHIVATINIDTNIQDKNIKNIVSIMLNNAPKITGSEGNADVFVNVLSGYNVFTNCDCKSCEYGDTIVTCKDGSFNCESNKDYECPWGRYQTQIVITIVGDLRDRFEEETKKEYNKFISYIENQCNFYIRNKIVTIIGD